MDFSEPLVQYGAMGLFVLYLIYDRQVLLKSLKDTLDLNTTSTNRLIEILEQKRRTK